MYQGEDAGSTAGRLPGLRLALSDTREELSLVLCSCDPLFCVESFPVVLAHSAFCRVFAAVFF